MHKARNETYFRMLSNILQNVRKIIQVYDVIYEKGTVIYSATVIGHSSTLMERGLFEKCRCIVVGKSTGHEEHLFFL